MKPFASELVALIREHQRELLGFVGTASAGGEVELPPTSDGDVDQMMSAFFHVLTENLEERGRAARDSQMETMIPGLRAVGFPLEMIVAGTMRLLVGMTGALVPRVSEPHRAAAAAWFADFSAEYATDILRACGPAR